MDNPIFDKETSLELLYWKEIYSVSNKTEFEFSHVVIDFSIYYLTIFNAS